MSHISDKIICPKCNTQNLRKSIVGPHNSKYSNQAGKEYFCDKDHEYFGIDELVHEWNYDLGDFAPSFEDYLKLGNDISNKIEREFLKRSLSSKPKLIEDKLVATTWFDFDSVSSFVVDEPTFKSPSERLEAYEMVDRMIIGIPEWSMENNEVDTGATYG